jgi:hypothetical protein
MKSRLKTRLSFANVVASLALFVALGGTAYATGALPADSVGTAQLEHGSVTSGKVKDGTLKAVDFAKKQLLVGPKGATGPAGPAGTVDTSQFYTKALSDGRYLGGALVTVVAAAPPITVGTFGGATATCPTGYQAISGGADPENVDSTILTSSEPVVENLNVDQLTVGQHGAPSAWRAFAFNNGTGSVTFNVIVICAPLG